MDQMVISWFYSVSMTCKEAKIKVKGVSPYSLSKSQQISDFLPKRKIEILPIPHQLSSWLSQTAWQKIAFMQLAFICSGLVCRRKKLFLLLFRRFCSRDFTTLPLSDFFFSCYAALVSAAWLVCLAKIKACKKFYILNPRELKLRLNSI